MSVISYINFHFFSQSTEETTLCEIHNPMQQSEFEIQNSESLSQWIKHFHQQII